MPPLPPGATLDQPQGQDQRSLKGFISGIPDAAMADVNKLKAAGEGAANAASFGLIPKNQALAEANPISNAVGAGVGAVAGGLGLERAGVGLAKMAMPQLAAKIGAALAPELSVDGQRLVAMAKIRNVARLSAQASAAGAAYGGVSGGVQGAQQNGVPGAVAGTAEGAALGGGLGAAGGVALAGAPAAVNYFSSAWKDAGAVLAKTFNMPVSDLQAALTELSNRTGGEKPAMVDIATLHNRGDLQKLAAQYKGVGVPVEARNQAMTAAAPRVVSGDVENILGPPQTEGPLQTLAKENFKAGFKDIKDNPVDLNDDELRFLNDPKINRVIGRNRAPEGEPLESADRLNLAQSAASDQNALDAAIHSEKPTQAMVAPLMQAAAKSRAAADADPLTVNDIDNFRQQLRGEQAVKMNPNSLKPNNDLGLAYGRHADTVAAMNTEDRAPGYATLLKNFGNDQDYAAGFAHGYTGKPMEETTDPATIRALNNVNHGIPGFQAGLRSHVFDLANKGEAAGVNTAANLSQDNALTQNLQKTFGPKATELQARMTARNQVYQNLKDISPGRSPTEEPGVTPNRIAQTGMALAHPASPWAPWHVVKAVVGHDMPNALAKQVGDLLTDPNKAPAALAAMRASGADANKIRVVQRILAARGGNIAAAAAAPTLAAANGNPGTGQ